MKCETITPSFSQIEASHIDGDMKGDEGDDKLRLQILWANWDLRGRSREPHVISSLRCCVCVLADDSSEA